MNMVEKEVVVKDLVTKSNLPASDYVINPYVGCPHGCRYCYACFMKRFTNHSEAWGSFIDIKRCDKPISKKKLQGKSVFLSSVTDCYNPFEEKYENTRKILEQLISIDCELNISTKSQLILRDIDLLKQCKNLKVSVSVNTLDEQFKSDMDRASSIGKRLETIETLHENGIYTVLFMSPIFPGITDYKEIIVKIHRFVDEYWFENLNLRGSYKQDILSYIKNAYPQLVELYDEIYVKGNMGFWNNLSVEIEEYCVEHSIKHINYFYHKELVEAKLKPK
ncbi:radical SAM protein [Schaedlerella arabinosiphila]|uniref:Radical SAM protein n=1 Tax=Schaedlerella arabinosiphila TaxID=2044587 RepID=A0A3R8LDK8_9FIRM|nr:radical SAM protein [Schaedlerella arabinosiphila]RRK31051.1 radical SAM protein [Schaedlerella arabinosiphila]